MKGEDNMSNELSIITSKNFNGVKFDCYKAEGNNNGDFWATREQIGQLLGYDNPNNAITIIHKRNPDRLNKFSTSVKLTQVEGNRTVTREVIVYSFKGLLEICRFSNQPKANAVMDFLWEIADEIRKRGFYATPAKVEEILQDPDNWIKVLTELKAERQRANNLESEKRALEAKVETDRPKVLFAESVDASKDSILVGVLAGLLRQNGLDIGQTRLFNWLRNHGFLCKTKGYKWNFPTQKSLDLGLFEVKERIVTGSNGINLVRPTPMVTGKGQLFFINKFLSGEFEI